MIKISLEAHRQPFQFSISTLNSEFGISNSEFQIPIGCFCFIGGNMFSFRFGERFRERGALSHHLRKHFDVGQSDWIENLHPAQVISQLNELCWVNLKQNQHYDETHFCEFWIDGQFFRQWARFVCHRDGFD